MDKQQDMSFWEHLDELRGVLIRCLVVWLIATIVVFFFRDTLFAILFAPAKNDFILYRLLCRIAEATGWQAICPQDFTIGFINTELTRQFMTHLEVSLCMGAMIVSPYLIVQFYGFISPALYEKEKRYSRKIIFWAVVLFLLGILLNYFIIFPFSFRFLGTYQVNENVVNQISLTSYISTFLVTSLLLGIMFELPVLSYILAKTGIIDASLLRRYRRHAIVAIVIVAAVITPTADIFTLLIVSIPIYLLYELSILIVSHC